MNIIQQLTKKCFKKDRLNILTSPCHERFQSNWKDVPHDFWLIHVPGGKTWDSRYAKLPKNHRLIAKDKGLALPPELEIDVVISQNKFDCYQFLSPIAERFKIPFISIEHTAPVPNWPQQQIEHMRDKMKGDINVFITDWSRERWGWKAEDCEVIYHGIDTEIFKPLDVKKEDYILTTVNQYSKPVRHWCCGWPILEQVVQNDLKWKNVGDDPGLSQPANSLEELVLEQNRAAIFLNTSTFSPIPMSVMEAMACGSCVVSLNTCEIPRFIKHGENGFLGENAQELRKICVDLLGNPTLRYKVGQNAKNTILERFGLDKFTKNWSEVLSRTSSIRKI